MSQQTSYWRQSKKDPNKWFASPKDFLADSTIPQNIRNSYQEFINNTNPANLKKNPKSGWYTTGWTEEDKGINSMYTCTYDEKFYWGIMKDPLKKQSQPKVDEGQTVIPASADYTEVVNELREIKGLLEALVQIQGGPMPINTPQVEDRVY